MCARACPTETLCEQACVREAAESKPVEIGRLQRFATDALMARDGHPYERAAFTGKLIAVVGAGPAGLACAHRLAMKGHDVTLFDAHVKAGGLNEFGIASYKTVDRFAEREVEWLLGIGGITVELGRRLGDDLTLEGLAGDYDAVFLGLGLAGVNALGVEEQTTRRWGSSRRCPEAGAVHESAREFRARKPGGFLPQGVPSRPYAKWGR